MGRQKVFEEKVKMAKWIKDFENDFINVDRMECIYIKDVGKDYRLRWEVRYSKENLDGVLAKFEEEVLARCFMENVTGK